MISLKINKYKDYYPKIKAKIIMMILVKNKIQNKYNFSKMIKNNNNNYKIKLQRMKLILLL